MVLFTSVQSKCDLKMKKTIMALSASVAMLTSAQADACHKFSGMHIGVQGGVLNLGQKGSHTSNSSTATNNISSPNKSLGKNGYTGAIAFGYGMQFNANFAAFVEAYIGKDRAEGKSDNQDKDVDTTNVKMKSSKKKMFFGFSVNPGVVINQNTLAFIKLGYEFGKHTLNAEQTGEANAVKTTKKASAHKKSYFVLGLGIKTMVTNNVILGVSAEHLFLRKLNTNITHAGYDRAPLRNMDYKAKGGANRFLVSVAYKF